MAGIQIAPGDLSRVFTYTAKTIPGVQSVPMPGICFEDSEGRKFKFCINGHTVAQTAGNFGSYDFNGAALTLASGPLFAVAGQASVVFKPSTATLMFMAGVWLGAAPLSSATQTGAGWVQFEGVCDPSTSVPTVGNITLPGGLVDGTGAVSIGDTLKLANAVFTAAKDGTGGTTLPISTNFAVALVAQAVASGVLSKILLCCGQVK